MNIVNTVEVLKEKKEYPMDALTEEQRRELALKFNRISLEAIGYRIKTA